MLSPIVLFVYNRPWHTHQTLESLQRNELADQSTLYIYADGPKPDASAGDLEKVKEVRKVIKQKQWCKYVNIIESSVNKGLKNSIISGVTEVINQYGHVIVLEDDLVTSPGFLKFMNEALDYYQNNSKVMHITGYMFPLKQKLPENFFYQVMSCWGWATWQEAWNKLIPSSQRILDLLEKKDLLSHFDLDNSGLFLPQLKNNIAGKSNTWAILWYGSIYLNEGLCLYPGKTLVKNIGMDGSGENCSNTMTSDVHLANKINVYPIPIQFSSQTRKVLKRYCKYRGNSILKHHYNVMKGKVYRLIYR